MGTTQTLTPRPPRSLGDPAGASPGSDPQITRLEAKIDALTGHIDYLVERQRWQADLVDEMMPILRLAMNVGADNLHDLEQKGFFAFGREAVRVVERIVESYSEEDVRALGGHIVGIMDTVKNVTQPAILQVANEATDVLHHADDVQPMGMMGMVRATRDDDTQKGMAIVFEVLRQIGRTASASSPSEQPKARLGDAPPPAPTNGSNGRGFAAAPAPVAPPSSAAPAEAATGDEEQGEGWALCAAGHLKDPSQWTEEFALAMAASLGHPELSAEQWVVIRAARQEFSDAGASPNIRRLTAVAGVTTKELYTLFPRAPGRTVSKIAGIARPVGCL